MAWPKPQVPMQAWPACHSMSIRLSGGYANVRSIGSRLSDWDVPIPLVSSSSPLLEDVDAVYSLRISASVRGMLR
ncbi:hypothetical protein AB1N83_006825 [Pleurotus pulmonarius]